jgi:hypothetical protein
LVVADAEFPNSCFLRGMFDAGVRGLNPPLVSRCLVSHVSVVMLRMRAIWSTSIRFFSVRSFPHLVPNRFIVWGYALMPSRQFLNRYLEFAVDKTSVRRR